jgi:hypothetical protein
MSQDIPVEKVLVAAEMPPALQQMFNRLTDLQKKSSALDLSRSASPARQMPMFDFLSPNSKNCCCKRGR